MKLHKGDVVKVEKTWYRNDRHLVGRVGVVTDLRGEDPIVHIGTRAVRTLAVSR